MTRQILSARHHLKTCLRASSATSKLQLESCTIPTLSPSHPRSFLCAKLHWKMDFFWHPRLSGLSHGGLFFPCNTGCESDSEGAERYGVRVACQVSTLQRVFGHSSVGDCTYLTIASMAWSPPTPELPHFSFRLFFFCISQNPTHLSSSLNLTPSPPGVVMMIGSGPAAICRPPPFLTELLSPFSLQLLQCAYALIVQHFLHRNVKPWEDVPF